MDSFLAIFIYEPARDKTYNKVCVTSKYSDQPVHPPRTARLLVYFSLDSLEAVEGASWSESSMVAQLLF